MDAGLMTLLGCPHVVEVDGVWAKIVCPDMCAENLSAIHYCIPQLLEVAASSPIEGALNITSLLAGIVRHEMWETLLRSPCDAYNLAVSILSYIETYTPEYLLDATTRPQVCTILNEWLKPVVEWSELPPEDAVARSLFGDAWVGIFNVPNSDGENISIAGLVRQQRPLFLPGLCPAQSPQMSAPLPALDISM